MTHNYTTIARTALLFLLLASAGAGCTSDSKDKNNDTAGLTRRTDSIITEDSMPEKPAPVPEITVEVFEVPAANGQPKGFGYDLLVNGKKTVHQPMIPAVQGNKSFATEQDAKAVGELAASRMRKTGELPTISIKELDSLKITYK
jgi:hypothetical protein